VIYAKRLGDGLFVQQTASVDLRAWLRTQDPDWEGEVFVVDSEGAGRRWLVAPARHGIKVLND
jgi:hypothetical protein